MHDQDVPEGPGVYKSSAGGGGGETNLIYHFLYLDHDIERLLRPALVAMSETKLFSTILAGRSIDGQHDVIFLEEHQTPGPKAGESAGARALEKYTEAVGGEYAGRYTILTNGHGVGSSTNCKRQVADFEMFAETLSKAQPDELAAPDNAIFERGDILSPEIAAAQRLLKADET